ncbi:MULTISPECIES: response regulator [unclassified Pseudomonas]|uniref:response regulator n=1 Tax=unclassified Pseudomonas TaxID=196821 RepID=UPI0035BF0FF3
MHRLNVLIVQDSPSHHIPMHQAFNALGVFNVRIVRGLAQAKASLLAEPVDLLVLDHEMPTLCGMALLKFMQGQSLARALLFVGAPGSETPDLSREARRLGAWVLAQVPWPLPVAALQVALKCLERPGDARSSRGIETVMSPAHAR